MNDTVDEIGESLDKDDRKVAKEEGSDDQPLYRMVGDSRIPVSKRAGPLWKSRWQQGKKKVEDLGFDKLWDQCIRYYQNDQSGEHRKDVDAEVTNYHATENIVFANVSAMLPSTYAKNPDVEVTAEDEKHVGFAKTAEKLVNTLLKRDGAPGVGLKSKARKCVVNSTLTNLSYLQVGYVQREESSEQALKDLQEAGELLQEAKSQEEIKRAEAQLYALERKVSFLRPPGPEVRYKRHDDVVVDCDADCYEDAQYLFVRDFLSSEYVMEVFGERENDQYRSIYEATHILTGTNQNNSTSDEINTFTLFNKEDSWQDYGFDDEHTYKSAQRMCVWYVWDKVTRQVLMFNENDWTWPLWVWEDPLKLECFFNVFPLEFNTDPIHIYAKSEVAYYLDQQDEINRINSEQSAWRTNASNRFFYNSNVVDGDMVEQMLEMDDLTNKKAIAVKNLPPDADMTKATMAPFINPSAQVQQIFDKTQLLQSVDRISSVTNIQRGVEFKANTTNRAVESYESSSLMRIDEKIDAVEDFIGRVARAILQCCLRFMEPDDVGVLIGDEHRENWQAAKDMLDNTGTMYRVNLQIVGGSALKPNSRVKKEDALQMMQVLGQIANAAPMAIVVLLKSLQKAFDDLTITDDDWEQIIASIEAQLQQGNTTQAGQGGAQPGAGGQPAPQQGADPIQQLLASLPPELAEIVMQLPPELQEQIVVQLQQGVPIEEIVAGVHQQLGQGQGQTVQ